MLLHNAQYHHTYPSTTPTEWPLCEVIEGNRGTTLNLTAPAHAILNLLTDTTPSTRYAVHARLAADTSSAGCLGIEACALAVDATHVLVTAVGTGQPMLLRVDDTVVDLVRMETAITTWTMVYMSFVSICQHPPCTGTIHERHTCIECSAPRVQQHCRLHAPAPQQGICLTL